MLRWTLLSIALVSVTPLDVEVAVRVVSSMDRYFSGGSVFLLLNPNATSLSQARMLVILQRRLEVQGIPTAATSYEEALLSLSHANNLPLIVLFGAESLVPLKQSVLSFAYWLLLLEVGTTGDVLVLLEGIHIPFDSEFIVARQTSSGGVELTEVYGVIRGGNLYQDNFGYMTSNGKLSHPSGGLALRRLNLHGTCFSAVVTQDPPFENITVHPNGTVHSKGFFSEVWRHLERRLNFKTNLSLATGMTAGSRRSDGTWTGMSGQLVRGEAMLSYNRVTMTASRAEVMDFTVPLVRTQACIFVKASVVFSDINWAGYMLPFSRSVWLCMAVLMLTMAAVLTATHYRLDDSLLFVWASFCGQAFHSYPNSYSARVAFWITQKMATIFLAAYSAKVIAHLAEQTNQLPFKDMNGLLRHGGFELAVTARSGLFTNFQTATDRTLKEVYQRLVLPQLNQLPKGRLEGLQNICRRPRYAFMLTQDFVAGLNDQLDCDLEVLPDSCFPVSLSMALSPNLGLTRTINYYLQEMERLGILRALMLRHWPQRPIPAPKQLNSVTLNNVLPLLVVMLIGAAIATVFLLAEKSGSGRHTRINDAMPFQDLTTRRKRQAMMCKRRKMESIARLSATYNSNEILRWS